MSYRPLAIFFLGGKTLDFPSTRARKRLCWSQRTGFTASVRVPTETDLATEPTYTQYHDKAWNNRMDTMSWITIDSDNIDTDAGEDKIGPKTSLLVLDD